MNKRKIKKELLLHLAEMLRYDVDEWAAQVFKCDSASITEDQEEKTDAVIMELRKEFYNRAGYEMGE